MAVSRIAAVALVGLAVMGCEGTGPKEGAGTLVGAGLGALVGSQFGSGTGRVVGTALGAAVGGYAGGSIGRSLDAADRQILHRETLHSLEQVPTGQARPWRNPDSGHHGTIVPNRTFTDQRGKPCREFQQTVIIGGRSEQAYGTACREDDGSWRIVSN